MTNITTQQDERNQHAVIVAHEGQVRVYVRSHSLHTACEIAATLRRDVARHGFAAIEGCFDVLPEAMYRTTKSGKKLLIANAG